MVEFGTLGIKFSSGPRWFGSGKEPRDAWVQIRNKLCYCSWTDHGMFTECSWTGLNFWWTLSCSLNLSQILCEHYLVHEVLSNFGEHYQWTLSSAEIFIIHELDNEIWAKLHMNIILFMKYLVRRSWTLSCSPNYEISWTAKPGVTH